MDFVNLPLLAAAGLVFTSVLAGLFSARIGFSFLLVFLFAGILAGEDGPGGYRFDDFKLSFWVGNLALAIILLDGGLRTTLATFRTGLRPAALLASLGVILCAGITAVAGVVFVGLDWGTALLLGSIVGSTDAAAVFSLLTRSGVELNERVAATLEIESGVNDPMAVYMTLALITLLASNTWTGNDLLATARTFAQQFGWGAAVGVSSGFAMAALLHRVASRDAGGGILALLIGASGLCVFAGAGLLDGSGFLAVYLYGLIAGFGLGHRLKPDFGRAACRRVGVLAAVSVHAQRDLVHCLGRAARCCAHCVGAVSVDGRHTESRFAFQHCVCRGAGVAAHPRHHHCPDGSQTGRGPAGS